MKRKLRVSLVVTLTCIFLFSTTRRAQAGDIPSQSQVIAIGIAVGAIGAVIGVGIFFLVRHSPTLTGCARSTSAWISFQNEGDQKTYMLMGDTAVPKTGDRLRIKGKKKKDSPGHPAFLVDKVSKDFGPCKVASSTP